MSIYKFVLFNADINAKNVVYWVLSICCVVREYERAIAFWSDTEFLIRSAELDRIVVVS